MTPVTARRLRVRACLLLSATALISVTLAGRASAAGLMVEASVTTHQSAPSSSITSSALTPKPRRRCQ